MSYPGVYKLGLAHESTCDVWPRSLHINCHVLYKSLHVMVHRSLHVMSFTGVYMSCLSQESTCHAPEPTCDVLPRSLHVMSCPGAYM